MKFFVFNIAVIGALAYLLWGNSQNSWDSINQTRINQSIGAPVKSAFKQAKEVAKEKLRTLEKSSVNKGDNPDISQTTGATKVEPEENARNLPVNNSIQKEAKDVKIPVIEVAKRPVPIMKSPTKRQRKTNQKDPLKESSQQTNGNNANSKFMTAKERRRELNKLAREMELLFVDKLAM